MADTPMMPIDPDSEGEHIADAPSGADAETEAAAIKAVEQIAHDAESPPSDEGEQTAGDKLASVAGCFSRVTLMVNLLTLFTLAVYTVTMRPRVAKALSDAELELPAMTKAVLTVASWKLITLFLAIAAAMIAKEFVIKNKWLAFALNLMVVPLLGVFVGVFVVAVFSAVTQATVPGM